MTKKRIFFTGGSGKAGKHMIPYLLDQGHRVMNVDLCVKKDGLGYQVFNAGNDHNAAVIPSKQLAEQFFPGVRLTREMGKLKPCFQTAKYVKSWGLKNSIIGRNMWLGYKFERKINPNSLEIH